MFLFHPPNPVKIYFGDLLQAALKASIFPFFTGITPTNFTNNTRRYYSSDTPSQSQMNPPAELPVGRTPICPKNNQTIRPNHYDVTYFTNPFKTVKMFSFS